MLFISVLFMALTPLLAAAAPTSSTDNFVVPQPISPIPRTLSVRDGAETCVPGNAGYGFAPQLRACVDWFVKNPSFGTWNCAGKTWGIGGNAWNSAGDCVNGCKDCLYNYAGQGLHWGKCDRQESFAHCWFIYCNAGTSC